MNVKRFYRFYKLNIPIPEEIKSAFDLITEEYGNLIRRESRNGKIWYETSKNELAFNIIKDPVEAFFQLDDKKINILIAKSKKLDILDKVFNYEELKDAITSIIENEHADLRGLLNICAYSYQMHFTIDLKFDDEID